MSANYKCDGCGKIVNCEHVELVSGKGLCRECSSKHWEKESEKSFEKPVKPATDVDIHKIIDDAMEKKDRSVTIFINKDATTVSVYPYEDKAREWIPYRDKDRVIIGWVCPECGLCEKHLSQYCPSCGEKLKRPNHGYLEE